MTRSAYLLTFALLLAAPGRAAVLHVPADFPTIQAGIDATASGDVVQVACGTYFEYDIVMKPNITIRSESEDPSCVTIDAMGLGRVMVGDELTNFTAIKGLTMQGGQATGPWPKIYGGGLDLTLSNPRITNCVFIGNTAEWGGGMAIRNQSDPIVEDCFFTDNAASIGSELLIINRSYPLMLRCIVVGGTTHIYDFTHPVFRSCTLYQSRLHLFSLAEATLKRTIVYPHPVTCFTATLEADCSLVLTSCAPQGSGNFYSDPLFCDPDNGNFSLMNNSPCAPPGVTGCGLVGALPVGCGPVTVVGETWAKIKTRYR